ncbi:MAG: hypothetical protein HYT70_03380 [Candidatus Aenigmarchaeota archaeon]|nr:hypothetical protein [Candidatus Aenigmarchaeota archaeon]
MFEEGYEDLGEYCFRFMMNKGAIEEFLKANGIRIRVTSYEKTAKELRASGSFIISIDQIRNFVRKKWVGTDIGYHLINLKSGLLEGHNWHGSMPSFLHLSFQNKVREWISQGKKLKELLKVGEDVMKQEYFIVATHDLSETTIIKSVDDVIPSIAQKGVSDFVFKGIPYDLKNSGVPNGWSFSEAKDSPAEFASSLIGGADVERLRKQANNSINNWGLNRFYVILKDTDDWLKKPEDVLEKIKRNTSNLGNPIRVSEEDLSITCQLLYVD